MISQKIPRNFNHAFLDNHTPPKFVQNSLLISFFKTNFFSYILRASEYNSITVCQNKSQGVAREISEIGKNPVFSNEKKKKEKK